MGWLDWLSGERDVSVAEDATPIGEARDGRVLLRGTVHALGPLLAAPSDGAECVWYLTKAESLPGPMMDQPRLGANLSEGGGVAFVLEDASGRALVDLSEARIEGPPLEHALSDLGDDAHHWLSNLRREAGHPRLNLDPVLLRELRVCPGEPILVDGHGAWTTDVPSQLRARETGYRSSPRVFLLERIERVWRLDET